MKTGALLGHDGSLTWKQEADALVITCPPDVPFETAVGIKVGLGTAAFQPPA